MISVSVKSHRFQLRAAAVAIEGGHVLLHRLEGDTFWALPGGRVEAGEQGSATVVREFQEELGLRVECCELLGVGENFFSHEGEAHHEIGLYFSIALPCDSVLRDFAKIYRGIEGARNLDFKWFPLDQLLVTDLRPTALRLPLSSGNVPRHFIQHG